MEYKEQDLQHAIVAVRWVIITYNEGEKWYMFQ
jgi:hypothetical protein